MRFSTKRIGVLLFAIVCTTLACAEVHIRTLAPGPIAFDSTRVAIRLRSAVNEPNKSNEVCITVDTTRYLIYTFRGLQTLTVRPRRPSDFSNWLSPDVAPDSTAISVDVQLEASNGERAAWQVPGGLSDSGARECLGSFEFRPGVFYTRLWLRSTRPVVITKVEWSNRPHSR